MGESIHGHGLGQEDHDAKIEGGKVISTQGPDEDTNKGNIIGKAGNKVGEKTRWGKQENLLSGPNSVRAAQVREHFHEHSIDKYGDPVSAKDVGCPQDNKLLKRSVKK